MAERECEVCSAVYTATKPSKFCSDRCRMRARRASGSTTSEPRTAPARVVLESIPVVVGGVAAAVEGELGTAGRSNTPLGRLALALAARIDTAGGADTGSAVASLGRELRATLSDALKGARAAADPVDELRAKRDAKRSFG